MIYVFFFFFSSRRRHTRLQGDWSSDVCSSDLIVAHIHYVLFGGSLFAIFGAITFWYPKMFGRMMNVRLGQIHFFLTFIFYNAVFFPMHQLGLHGHMRRIYDPTRYDFLKPLAGLNRFISIAAFL